MKNKFTEISSANVRLSGITDQKIHTVLDGILKKIDMHALADYFRYKSDLFATGEFWGKLMRASCLVYEYTQDSELRTIIDDAAEDMMSIQREDGCISTCPDSVQPKGTHGSDLWERKYVLMGLYHYWHATKCEKALECAVKLIEYTNSQLSKAPKTEITDTGWAFYGIESSSILDPVMKIALATNNASAFELADYIVSSGCCKRENIFKAIENGKHPKDIGGNGVAEQSIAKAYEMTSCFEGLCEYYRHTGKKKYLSVVEKYWDEVNKYEITLLGAGGADKPYNLGPGTGEQWNNTALEQTNPDINLMMETCVTVYWMRLCYQLLMITGKVKYADALEVSLYNAIFGALRPDGMFFEYFPKFNGSRNAKVNFSFNISGIDLSCCTANGPTALGMAPKIAFMKNDSGAVFNLYESGEYRLENENGSALFRVESDYPAFGNVKMTVADYTFDGKITLLLRVPSFAENFTANIGKKIYNGISGEYIKVKVGTDDIISIKFDIPVVKHKAPFGSNRAGDNFVAFTYGSILLARDGRNCDDVNELLDDGRIYRFDVKPSVYGGFLSAEMVFSGKKLELVDYMSAGNNWNGGMFASWLPIRQ